MADVGFQNGSIRLEEIPAAYYSGQTINGSVVFDLREPLNFSVIYIQYVGEANVLWSYTQIDTIHGRERKSEIKYQGHEEYFNYTETLAGGQGISQLPRTHHAFPFKFQIPFTAPSSFKGQKGSVTYRIIATMAYNDTRREVLEKVITVVAPLDLNTGNPALKEPIDLELEELNTCNWCCESGPVTIRIRIPVTGYCPGQTIPIAIDVQNKSSVEITEMVFEILTKELYRSTQPPSEYVVPGRVLATVKRGAIMSKTKRNFTCGIVVPDMIAPYLENCGIIDVGYFFRATISLSGCNDELQEESEICLGLVPLRETLISEYIHPMADSLPSGPIPVNDGSVNSIPPRVPTPVHHGSHHNINRSQPNLSQKDYQQDPPPYPGGNLPYPTENKLRNSTGDIGFRTPQRLSISDVPYPAPAQSNSPYPSSNLMPGGVPPYPVGNVMPGGAPYPYPARNSSHDVSAPYPQANNSGLPTYAQAGFAPSAPPATE
ncbi:unnamed protein product [Arctia plantaginis]|uniref:Arrestin C-terminal-like domain-containing protein n=1 Tax=Arctia plantaginis TaxID=874455 RepID=A0A8S1AHW7_ARCPL|nr:unnamed protein product [Arctia plantaginis]CAB3260499.1 unnamed protein product [Arctia plantaginis]